MSEKLIPHEPTAERGIFGPRLRILTFSDYRIQDISKLIEYVRKMVFKPDVIVYAGDDLERFEEGSKNLFSQLGELAEHGVLAVAGNDDTRDCKRVLCAKHVHDLHEKPYIIGDIAFVGQEGSRGDIGLLLYSEKEIHEHLEKQIKKVKGKKLILVAHSPPYGLLDFARRFGIRHIGSHAIRQILEKYRPVLHICGHVHIYGGQSERLGPTTVLNIASEDYTNAPSLAAMIELWQDLIQIDCFAIEESELMQLYGIGPVRSEQLLRAGLISLEQVARSSIEKIVKKTKLSPKIAWWARLSAKALTTGRTYQISEFCPPEHPIYLDVETTPNECFMTGVYLPEDETFKQFTVKNIKNQAERKRVTTRLCRFLKDANGTIVTFTAYDVPFLPPSIRGEKPHYDLYQGIRNVFILPTSNYTLKSIGETFGYHWKNPNLVGWDMPRLYHDYKETHSEEYLRLIEGHNRDDVMAMPHLVKKLREKNIATKCHFDRSKYARLKGEYITARRWTKEEMDFLRRNFTRPIPKLASKLNRSPEAVEWKMEQIKITLREILALKQADRRKKHLSSAGSAREKR